MDPYRKGHPVAFFLVIVSLCFGMVSGAAAISTQDKCDTRVFNGEKHWQVMPPKWVCGPKK